MTKEKRHVIPADGKWAVKAQDGERASRVFNRKADAVDYAEEVSSKHNGCIIVHDRLGKFERVDCNIKSGKMDMWDSLGL